MPPTNGDKAIKNEHKMSDREKTIIALGLIILLVVVIIYVVPWLISLPSQILPEYDLRITVLDTDIQEEYTGDSWEHTLIVDVKIENTGNEELYVSYSDFYILTKDRRIISSTLLESTIILDELPVGTWISGEIAFDYDLSEVSYEELDKLVFEKELFGDDIHFEWNLSDLGAINVVPQTAENSPPNEEEKTEKNDFQVVGAFITDFDETVVFLNYSGETPVNVSVYVEYYFDELTNETINFGIMERGDVVDFGRPSYITWCDVIYDENRIKLTFTPQEHPDW